MSAGHNLRWIYVTLPSISLQTSMSGLVRIASDTLKISWAFRMPPPATPDRLARDPLRKAGDRPSRCLEHDPMPLDESHSLFRVHITPVADCPSNAQVQLRTSQIRASRSERHP